MSEIVKDDGELFGLMDHKGRKYITSQRFHRDVQPCASLSATNKAIRGAETYKDLVDKDHIVEMSYERAKATESNLESVIKSNSYNPIMLIDPVAQKALEHHFKETAKGAIQDSGVAAALSLTNIRMDLLLSDPKMRMLLESCSHSMAAEKDALAAREIAMEARIEARLAQQRVSVLEAKVKEFDGETGYRTVVAYGRLKEIPMPLDRAKRVGKMASAICRERNVFVGRVGDEHWNTVGTYPIAILDEVMESLGGDE